MAPILQYSYGCGDYKRWIDEVTVCGLFGHVGDLQQLFYNSYVLELPFCEQEKYIHKRTLDEI
jgi:hypothetical protein